MSIIGLKRKTVKLVPYSQEWPEIFEKEKALILRAIGEQVADVQHIGSTSVPGLYAKPIIDIAAGVHSLDVEGRMCTKPLERIGYVCKNDAGVPGRIFFSKGREDLMTHHLDVVEYGGIAWNNYIRFREYMRSHKKAREEYAKLKKALAGKFANDRDSYTAKKEEFIKRILLLAGK